MRATEARPSAREARPLTDECLGVSPDCRLPCSIDKFAELWRDCQTPIEHFLTKILRSLPADSACGATRDDAIPEMWLPANDVGVAYAHTLPGFPPSEWETVEEHARRVADLARSFAGTFGAEEWGSLLGLWHDLGKRSAEFQQYIRKTCDPNAGEEQGKPGLVDHSTFGAQHAARTLGGHFGQILAFCIAGHHGALPDAFADDESAARSTLHARLEKGVPAVTLSAFDAPSKPLRLPFRPDPAQAGFQVAFFTRMIFSALIDADRTATEQFCNPDQAALRNRAKPSIPELLQQLQTSLEWKTRLAEPTLVNRVRSSVLDECFQAARLEPGFFSLTVPTGGGKTLSSLAFALRHAAIHELRRVVVAIPFTSIIEQTADVYREALQTLAYDGLIEHHSDIPEKHETRHNKLASENWDAPLVVTTNVQLYESLFAARGTPCRKLHRLARSVIVLDEAQTIPVELLEPTLHALKELVDHYGCTVVLCTATQPALEYRQGEFEMGLRNVRPIVSDVTGLFADLRRITVTRTGKLSDDELADRLAAEAQVLCIVNTRPQAAQLFDQLVARRGRERCYHLSTYMCAQHRRDRLAEIRTQLKNGDRCRLISTQLIEAGVDVDFPVVYRASAGFDSIAQAAGRCNREGRLTRDGQLAMGSVFVVDTETPPPQGLQRTAAQCARELADRFPDPIAPAAMEAFFRLFYWSKQHHWDRCEVMESLADDLMRPKLGLRFKTAAERYRIIRDDQTPILVPYDDRARTLRDRLWRSRETDFLAMRAAQRYIVGVHEGLLKRLAGNGVAMQHDSGLWLLVNDQAYSSDKGLSPDAVGIDAELLIQ